MRRRSVIVIVLIAIVVAGFVAKVVYDNYTAYAERRAEEARIEREAQEAEARRVEAEQARLEAERLAEEARKKAEEEEAARKAKEAEMKASRRYAQRGGMKVYKSPDTTSEVIQTLPEKSEVYASEYIKNEAGEVAFAQIRTAYDAETPLGYVVASALQDSMTAFIAKAYSDVDYTPFQRHAAFEKNPPVKVKGLYTTGYSASGDKLEKLLKIIDETEVNALVIDYKDDNGYLLFHSPAAERYNPTANEHIYVKDPEALMKRLKEHNVYLIARIVTFKSPIYAKENPDKAIVHKGSGKLYSDRDRLLWASPHNRELWDYNIAVAKEAAEHGFNEIQFDYVRFPAISSKIAVDYRNDREESKTAVIQGFLKQAYEVLGEASVYVAADVFGWTATALDDVGIGQHWEALSNVVDYTCPMMYPSHYGPNNFGLSVPDAYPYETIDASIKDAISRNANIQTPGILRPWIQDFTATWVKGHIRYGARELKAQIKALKDNGVDEYLVWNPGNFYSTDAFEKE